MHLTGVFFTAQMILQLAWIRKFFTRDPVNAAQMNYALVYMVGSVCTGTDILSISYVVLLSFTIDTCICIYIAGWLILWTSEQFETALTFVTFNFFLHINEIGRLPPYEPDNALTHWVMKTTVGIGLLEIAATGAVIFVSELLCGGRRMKLMGFLHLVRHTKPHRRCWSRS